MIQKLRTTKKGKLTKNLTILVGSLFLIASTNCQTSPKPPPIVFDPISPKFPAEIKNFYVMDAALEPVSEDRDFTESIDNYTSLPTKLDFYKDDVQYACLKFEITSSHPFKLKYIGVTKWEDCHGVGGFKPKDHQLFFNHYDDLVSWSEHRDVQPKPSPTPKPSEAP